MPGGDPGNLEQENPKILRKSLCVLGLKSQSCLKEIWLEKQGTVKTSRQED